jgi:hypothetical protein
VETDDIRSINYISEGFLKRYTFTFKAKSSKLWGKIGKIMGIAALVVGAAACFLVPPGGQILGGTLLAKIVGTTAVAATATTPAIAATGLIGLGASIGLGTTAVLGITGLAAGAVAAGVVGGVVASAQELG